YTPTTEATRGSCTRSASSSSPAGSRAAPAWPRRTTARQGWLAVTTRDAPARPGAGHPSRRVAVLRQLRDTPGGGSPRLSTRADDLRAHRRCNNPEVGSYPDGLARVFCSGENFCHNFCPSHLIGADLR